MGRWEFSKSIFGEYLIFSKDVEVQVGVYPCGETETPKSLIIGVKYSGPTKGFYGPTTTNFNFLLKDEDGDKSPLYEVVGSKATAMQCESEFRYLWVFDRISSNFGKKFKEQPMNADEINRMCDTFSEEMGNFESLRYSSRHMADHLSRLFKKEDGPSEYKKEKSMRLELKEGIMRSLEQIRSKAAEPAA